jgi:hypothetical protein
LANYGQFSWRQPGDVGFGFSHEPRLLPSGRPRQGWAQRRQKDGISSQARIRGVERVSESHRGGSIRRAKATICLCTNSIANATRGHRRHRSAVATSHRESRSAASARSRRGRDGVGGSSESLTAAPGRRSHLRALWDA